MVHFLVRKILRKFMYFMKQMCKKSFDMPETRKVFSVWELLAALIKLTSAKHPYYSQCNTTKRHHSSSFDKDGSQICEFLLISGYNERICADSFSKSKFLQQSWTVMCCCHVLVAPDSTPMMSLSYPTPPVAVTATTALPTPVDATTVLPSPAISAAPALPSAVQPAKVCCIDL